MLIRIGNTVPDIGNLPGPSNGGGGGGGGSLPKIDNLYSFEFDGVGSYMAISESNVISSSNTGSVSLWVKPSTLNANKSIVVFDNGGYRNYLSIYIRDYTTGEIGVQYRQDSPRVIYTKHTNNGVVSVGNWTHITIVHNSVEPKIYINGIDVPQTLILSAGNNSTLWWNNLLPKNINLGAFDINGYSPPTYFPGYIDEVSIFNTALTQEQVESIYNATTTGKTADLSSLSPVAWYRMGD